MGVGRPAARSVLGWLADRLELSRGGRAGNLRSMEGLRGYAVFLVFLVHYTALAQPWLPQGGGVERASAWLSPVGHAGVDLFFVLSGFLIYGSLMARPQPLGPYAARRLQRIYPAFLVVFTLYLFISVAVPAQSKLPTGTPQALSYVLANLLLLPGLFPIDPLISVAWSLSYEVFYYLVIPLLIAALNLRFRTSTQRVALFVLLAVGFAFYSALNGGHVRLLMFLAGILLWEALHRNHSSTSKQAAWQVPCAIVGSVGATWLPTVLDLPPSMEYTMRTVALALSYGLLCFACFSAPAASATRLFFWAPLRWLGNASYSYYLIHGLALKVFFAVAGTWVTPGQSTALALSMLAPAFLFSCVPALLLYLFVERRFSLQTQSTAVRS